MEQVLGAPKGTGGYATLEQLAREGWDVAIVGEHGKLRAPARRGRDVVEASGQTIAGLAPFLLERCRRVAVAA